MTTSSRLCFALFFLATFASVVLSDVFESTAKDGTYQSLDGTRNNLSQKWGVKDLPYFRNTSVSNSYTDGKSVMRTEPSARLVSNGVFAFDVKNALNERNLNSLHTAFSQFVSNEIQKSVAPSSTPSQEVYNIPVPRDDPFFDVYGEGGKVIPFTRGAIDSSSGTSTARNLINFKTPFVDAGTVYGDNIERLSALRNRTAPEYLATQEVDNGELFPLFNNRQFPNQNDNRRKDLFLFGDERANTHPTLVSLHVLFTREHNRIVDEMKDTKGFKDLNADGLFYEARRRVIAYMQNIVFNEYVPAVIGSLMPTYEGYNEKVNPQIDTFFAAAAFRYSFSEMSTSVERLQDGDVSAIPLSLRDTIFHPEIYSQEGIDNVVRGALDSVQQTVRAQYVDDLRNFFLGFPGRGGTDLASLDIQSSRDFGLPNYNDARKLYGLDPVDKYEDIISDKDVVDALISIYGKDIEKADSFVVGMAEDHAENSNVGALFTAAIMAQFQRLRDGDRFYFENADAAFTEAEISFIKTQTISDLILRNTEIYELSCSGFFANTDRDCFKDRPADNSTGALGDPASSAAFLDGNVVVSWVNDPLTPDQITITVTALTTGWVSIAFPTVAGQLLDSDAIIAAGSGDKIKVADFYITDQNAGCPGICLDTKQGGTDDILTFSGSDDGTMTTFTFTRLLDTGDASFDVALVNDGNPTPVIIAFGATDELGFMGNNRQAGSIYFFEGVVVEEDGGTGPDDRLTVHGVLMVFAWLFCYPLGIFIVKFSKRLLPVWSLHFHMMIQYIGTLVIIVALILAVEAIAWENEKHIKVNHSILGVVSICLAILLPLLGQISIAFRSPSRRSPFFPDWIHYALGYIAPIFSCSAIFTGIWERTNEDKHNWWWYFLVGLWIVILFVTFMICLAIQTAYSIFVWRKKKDEHDSFDDEDPADAPKSTPLTNAANSDSD